MLEYESGCKECAARAIMQWSLFQLADIGVFSLLARPESQQDRPPARPPCFVSVGDNVFRTPALSRCRHKQKVAYCTIRARLKSAKFSQREGRRWERVLRSRA